MSNFDPIAGHIRRLQLQRSAAVGEAIAEGIVRVIRLFKRPAPARARARSRIPRIAAQH